MESKPLTSSDSPNTSFSPSDGRTYRPIATNTRDLDEALKRYCERRDEPDARHKYFIVKELLEGRPVLLSKAGRLLHFDSTDIEAARTALRLPVLIYDHPMLDEGPLLLPGNCVDLAFSFAITRKPKKFRGTYKCGLCGEQGHTKNQCPNPCLNETENNSKPSRKRKSGSSR
ncbi:hypothetical protein RCL1_008394 [Eukaryota sp. TZLM3-RCL]